LLDAKTGPITSSVTLIWHRHRSTSKNQTKKQQQQYSTSEILEHNKSMKQNKIIDNQLHVFNEFLYHPYLLKFAS